MVQFWSSGLAFACQGFKIHLCLHNDEDDVFLRVAHFSAAPPVITERKVHISSGFMQANFIILEIFDHPHFSIQFFSLQLLFNCSISSVLSKYFSILSIVFHFDGHPYVYFWFLTKQWQMGVGKNDRIFKLIRMNEDIIFNCRLCQLVNMRYIIGKRTKKGAEVGRWCQDNYTQNHNLSTLR